MKKIAYQGNSGSFSFLALKKAFGEKNQFFPKNSFFDVVQTVHLSEVDFAILPIENSLAGSIYEIYDLLFQHEVEILREIYLPIRLCFFTHVKTDHLKTIQKVFSHPKAFEQCKKFLQDHSWIEPVLESNTSLSAKKIAEEKNPTWAAIASKECQKIYSLHLVKKNIEDHQKNFTRFIVIQKKKKKKVLGNKGSCLFILPHFPGTLVKTLKEFSKEKINILKIESRPIQEKPFEYIFYVDFSFHKQFDIRKFIKKISLKTKFIKMLGIYKEEKIWTKK